MKSVQIAIGVILLVLGMVVLNSCTPTPLVTILWEDDGNGFIQFQTNDPANADQVFLKLYPTTYDPIVDPVEVTVKKISGAERSSFGVVFCASDPQNYWAVIITVRREYKIIKVTGGGVFSPFGDAFVPHSALNLDYNSENVIRITKSGPTFALFFNSTPTPITTFDDLGSAVGKNGFFVYVATARDEYLPAGVVDVRYKMTLPDSIP